MSDDATVDATDEGTIPKAEFRRRMNAKNKAIDEYKSKISELEGQVAELRPAADRVSELSGELRELRTRTARDKALNAAGISDERLAKRIETLYESDVDGMKEPTEFAEWLAGPAKEDPLIGGLFKAPAGPEDADSTKSVQTDAKPDKGAAAVEQTAPTADVAPQAVVTTPRATMPNTSKGAAPPAPDLKRSNREALQAFREAIKSGDREGAAAIRAELAGN